MENVRSSTGPVGAVAASAEPPGGASAGGGEATPADLGRLVAVLQAADRLMAEAVGLAGRLAASGVCERVEGLPLEHFVGLAARMTGADRRMLVDAGRVLADLPVAAGLFADGQLSWGQIRALVGGARRLGRADRALVDARLAATVAERGSLEGFDADHLVAALEAAVQDVGDARRLERREQRQAAAEFVSVQGRLDGGVALYAELCPVTAAGVMSALDAAAGPPRPDPSGGGGRDRDGEGGARDGDGEGGAREGGGDGGDGDGDGGDGPVGEPAGSGGWSATARARQYARALQVICAEWLGGGSGRPARPLLVSCVDTSAASVGAGGVVDLRVRGGLTRVSAATIERLAGDADLRVVLFDGARPLAVSSKVNAADTPRITKFAVGVRDMGCRFPGSTDPLAHSEIHHCTDRAKGGDHHPDRLVCLSRRFHQLTHRYGWTLTLDPSSGELTARRGRRTWRSLPRSTGLSPPRPPPPPPADPDLPF